MRLIASPFLEEADVFALQDGFLDRPEVLINIVRKSFTEVEDLIQRDRLSALSWLIATRALEVRLAVRVDNSGSPSVGIYHEKLGIFSDSVGQHVAFSGSANETGGGLIGNFESVDVFVSWDDPHKRVRRKIDDFEALWSNTTFGVKVLDFTEVADEIFRQYRLGDHPPWLATVRDSKPETSPSPPSSANDTSQQSKLIHQKSSPCAAGLTPPDGLVIREYQREAIRAWSSNKGRGIFAMATGTGKTITALTLATKVAERNADRPFAVIVLCPYINLCRQWEGEFLLFGVNAVGCYEGRPRWEVLFDEAHQRLHAGLGKMAVFVVSNATFLTDIFQARLRSRLSGQSVTYLIIADEAHNLGAKRIQQCLPPEISLRLALSATPDRHHDPEGTKAIFDYFGKIVYTFPLANAIAEGYLTPYEYHPILVTLSPEEAQQYWDITRELARFFPSEEGGELGEGAMRLLIRRARLIGAAADKLTQLDALLTRIPEKPRRALFYCGDGRVTDHVASDDKRQIEAVAQLLGNQHNLRVRTFTYREKTDEREDILRDLRSGFLDGVVAIRCLDEGIDLPALETGFLLASSSNPRQFVQRRGRLLRKAPGKDKATIYDFVVVPPPMDGDVNDAAFNLERKLFKSELKRISEFCQTALNGYAALELLAPLRKHYNLLTV
jgi:DNA phosphorothioation system restriction enzyme